jgi:hypothetical protein
MLDDLRRSDKSVSHPLVCVVALETHHLGHTLELALAHFGQYAADFLQAVPLTVNWLQVLQNDLIC